MHRLGGSAEPEDGVADDDIDGRAERSDHARLGATAQQTGRPMAEGDDRGEAHGAL